MKISMLRNHLFVLPECLDPSKKVEKRSFPRGRNSAVVHLLARIQLPIEVLCDGRNIAEGDLVAERSRVTGCFRA